ncbi:MAG: methyltransferase domain-containing protein [Pseudomonadota bacterium]
MTEKNILDRAYQVQTPEEIKSLYDDWADTYDETVAGNGYVTPQRCADALAAFSPDRSAPVLDLACGTGRAAHHFKLAGFETIDGADYSEGMLRVAAETGRYRTLGQCDLNEPFEDQLSTEKGFTPPYANIAAVGVLQPAYVKAPALERIIGYLRPGGVFVFSLNDRSLETGVFQDALKTLAAAGRIDTLFDVYGDHLPEYDLRARVYAARRLA